MKGKFFRLLTFLAVYAMSCFLVACSTTKEQQQRGIKTEAVVISQAQDFSQEEPSGISGTGVIANEDESIDGIGGTGLIATDEENEEPNGIGGTGIIVKEDDCQSIKRQDKKGKSILCNDADKPEIVERPELLEEKPQIVETPMEIQMMDPFNLPTVADIANDQPELPDQPELQEFEDFNNGHINVVPNLPDQHNFPDELPKIDLD